MFRAMDADSRRAAHHATETSFEVREAGEQGGRATVYVRHSRDKVRPLACALQLFLPACSSATPCCCYDVLAERFCGAGVIVRQHAWSPNKFLEGLGGFVFVFTLS